MLIGRGLSERHIIPPPAAPNWDTWDTSMDGAAVTYATTPTAGYHNSLCRMSEDLGVLAYKGSDGQPYLMAVRSTTTTPTLGSAVLVEAVTVGFSWSVTEMTATTGIVIYRNVTGFVVRACPFTVNPETLVITPGTPVTVDTGTADSYQDIARMTNTVAGVAYMVARNGASRAKKLTISGGAIVVDAGVLAYRASASAEVQCCPLDADNFMVMWKNTSDALHAHNVSSALTSTTLQIAGSLTAFSFPLALTAPNKVTLAARASGNPTVRTVATTGNNIDALIASTVVEAVAGSEYASITALDDAGKFLYVWRRGTGGLYGVVGTTAANDTITLGTIRTIDAGAAAVRLHVRRLSAGRVALQYGDKIKVLKA